MPKWTIRSLYQSGLRLSPTRANVAKSPAIRVDTIIPFAGVNSALFQLTLKGITQVSSNGYPVNHKVNLLFSGLNVTNEEIKGYIKVTDNTGTYFIEPPTANNTEVRVRCSCHDFYFTWGIWNFLQGAIFGNKPRPYVRKTPSPPQGRPFRNPMHYSGGCKHVWNAVNYLKQNGFMK